MTEYTIRTPTESIITRIIVEQVTLRDQFAMAALSATKAEDDYPKRIAEWAYKMADAMLEARKEKK